MISCGDDSIVVRANNSSLPENKICEKVVIANCNLTSCCSGIRIGWIKDGTIRNCTFSNIVMTDTAIGINIELPGRGAERLPDEGREYTLIENLSFSNMIMDRTYSCPIRIDIAENPATFCESIRNIYFSGIHVRGIQLPRLIGRKDCLLKNIFFNDCDFEKISLAEVKGKKFYGAVIYKDEAFHSIYMKNTENVKFISTSFTIKE